MFLVEVSVIDGIDMLLYHGRKLVGDGTCPPPTFLPQGTNYVLSHPFFDTDLILFYRLNKVIFTSPG